MIRLVVLAAVALNAGCVSPRKEPLFESKDAATPPGSESPDASSPPRNDGPAAAPDTAAPDASVGPPARDAAAPSGPDASGPPADAAADSAPPAACRADQISCHQSARCEPRSWGFEPYEELGGWDLRAYNGTIGGRRVRTGAASLAFEVFPDYSSTAYTFCGRGNLTSMYPGVDVRGKTLVAWVNLEVTSGTATLAECMVGGGGGGAVFRMPEPMKMTADRWIPLRVPIGADDINGSNAWSFYIQCFYGAGPAWKGLVHVDDVAFE